MTSSPDEHDREFYVRDIPFNFGEFDMVRIFMRFGSVHKVRFPVASQSHSRSLMKYGFVTMVNSSGADAVRDAICNQKLYIDDLVLTISEAKHIDALNLTVPMPKTPTKQVLPSFGMISTSPCPPAKGINLGFFKEKVPAVSPKMKGLHVPPIYKNVCNGYDLPLGKPQEVMIVPSPFPPTETFTFHVKVRNITLGPRYIDLQEKLNYHCLTSPAVTINNKITQSIAIGQAVIFGSEGTAYRAIRTSATTVYLVDVGETRPFYPEKIWLPLEIHWRLPTLVVTCALSRAQFLVKGAKEFTFIREVLIKWCCKVTSLFAVADSYRGSLNMVQLTAKTGDNLIESLSRKGTVRIIPEQSTIRYTREGIFQLRNKATSIPESLKRNNSVNDIVVAMGGISI